MTKQFLYEPAKNCMIMDGNDPIKYISKHIGWKRSNYYCEDGHIYSIKPKNESKKAKKISKRSLS